jgi:cytoskeletal protein CcmA (bactofilin family)
MGLMIMKKTTAVDKADIKAFLGAGSRFEGSLSFEDIVRVDGNFYGDITSSDTLIVGETAVIEGNVRVGSLILSGRFKGTITASVLVDLRAPAQVDGKISAPVLKIEEKVIFNGEVQMGDQNGMQGNSDHISHD